MRKEDDSLKRNASLPATLDHRPVIELLLASLRPAALSRNWAWLLPLEQVQEQNRKPLGIECSSSSSVGGAAAEPDFSNKAEQQAIPDDDTASGAAPSVSLVLSVKHPVIPNQIQWTVDTAFAISLNRKHASLFRSSTMLEDTAIDGLSSTPVGGTPRRQQKNGFPSKITQWYCPVCCGHVLVPEQEAAAVVGRIGGDAEEQRVALTPTVQAHLATTAHLQAVQFWCCKKYPTLQWSEIAVILGAARPPNTVGQSQHKSGGDSWVESDRRTPPWVVRRPCSLVKHSPLKYLQMRDSAPRAGEDGFSAKNVPHPSHRRLLAVAGSLVSTKLQISSKDHLQNSHRNDNEKGEEEEEDLPCVSASVVAKNVWLLNTDNDAWAILKGFLASSNKTRIQISILTNATHTLVRAVRLENVTTLQFDPPLGHENLKRLVRLRRTGMDQREFIHNARATSHDGSNSSVATSESESFHWCALSTQCVGTTCGGPLLTPFPSSASANREVRGAPTVGMVCESQVGAMLILTLQRLVQEQHFVVPLRDILSRLTAAVEESEKAGLLNPLHYVPPPATPPPHAASSTLRTPDNNSAHPRVTATSAIRLFLWQRQQTWQDILRDLGCTFFTTMEAAGTVRSVDTGEIVAMESAEGMRADAPQTVVIKMCELPGVFPTVLPSASFQRSVWEQEQR